MFENLKEQAERILQHPAIFDIKYIINLFNNNLHSDALHHLVFVVLAPVGNSVSSIMMRAVTTTWDHIIKAVPNTSLIRTKLPRDSGLSNEIKH